MSKFLFLRLASLFAFVVVGLHVAGGVCREVQAEPRPLSKQMRLVYDAYRKLQPFVVSPSRFDNQKNRAELLRLITTISANFHRVEAVDHRFANLPGFRANLSMVAGMLDEARARLKEGNLSYARWRLRAVSTYCITCHSTYDAGLEFADKATPPSGLNDLERAQFYLASRQLESAKSEYFKAINRKRRSNQLMPALRQWLILSVRMHTASTELVQTLKTLLPKLALSLDEQAQVSDWISSLSYWQQEKDSNNNKLVQAELLLKRAAGSEELLTRDVHAVEVLRATGLLHEWLEDNQAFNHERSRALYLLGWGYSLLPQYFVDELPEVYLAQCIYEAPGTSEAQRALRLYGEIIELNFTGSAGTEIPPEVEKSLEELRHFAFGKK